MASTGFGRSPRRDNPSHNSNPYGFGGLWDGVVVDDRDPEKLGRVRVRIFDLHDEDTPVDKIVWAMPNFPAAFVNPGDTERSGGFFHVPPVDSLVNVMFKHGDPGSPVWIGGWFQKSPCITGREKYGDGTRREALYNGSTQPSCPTWRSLRGHLVEMDDETGEIRITSSNNHKITLSGDGGEHGDCIKVEDRKGNYIWMNTNSNLLQIFWDGDVNEKFTGNVGTSIGGNWDIKAGGNINISDGGGFNYKSGGAIAIDGITIDLNSKKAQDASPAEPDKGLQASSESISGVMAKLGSQIIKIATGS
jgi:hypothetical protein